MPSGPQVFLLTGCAGGMGRHVAGLLAAQGRRLLVTDVNEKALEQAVQDGGWRSKAEVEAFRLDVRDPAAWEEAVGRAVSKWGRLDVLLNIAGYLKPGYIHEVPAIEVDLHFDINAKGVIHGTRAAARRMVAQGHGHIVNVASMAAIAPVPGIGLYSASKFAVRGFSLAAAQELLPQGVAVTVVCPDAVQTPMLDLQLDYEEAAMTFSGPRPLQVEEVGELILTKVLPERPLEVTLVPARSGRALAAKLVNAFPDLAVRLGPALRSRGRKAQKRNRNNG